MEQTIIPFEITYFLFALENTERISSIHHIESFIIKYLLSNQHIIDADMHRSETETTISYKYCLSYDIKQWSDLHFLGLKSFLPVQKFF